MSSLIFNRNFSTLSCLDTLNVSASLSWEHRTVFFGRGCRHDSTQIPAHFSPFSTEKYYASVHDYDFCMSISAPAGAVLLLQ